MEIAAMILKGLMVGLSAIICVLYMLSNLYKGLPSQGFPKFKTLDYVVYAIVAFMFGLGIGQNWAYALFLILPVWKILTHYTIREEKLGRSGIWYLIDWQKIKLRGLKGVPQEQLKELNRIPDSRRFILPTFLARIAIKLYKKQMQKNMGAGQLQVSKAQQKMAEQQMNMINGKIDSILSLGQGKQETISLPFGVLKVVRN